MGHLGRLRHRSTLHLLLYPLSRPRLHPTPHLCLITTNERPCPSYLFFIIASALTLKAFYDLCM